VNLALFDFDGTITTREMLPDFFRLAIPSRRLLIGKILLAPFIIGYKLRVVPGTAIRAAIVRIAFSGVPYSHYEQKGREFAIKVLPRFVRAEAI
jgi:hypothetical protein